MVSYNQVTGKLLTTVIDYDLGMEIKVPLIGIHMPIVIKGVSEGFKAPEALVPKVMVDGSKSDAWSVGASIYNVLTGLSLGSDYTEQQAIWTHYILGPNAPGPAIVLPDLNTAAGRVAARNMPVFPPASNIPMHASLVTILSIMDTLLTRDVKLRPTPEELLTGKTIDNRISNYTKVYNMFRGIKEPKEIVFKKL
jgi:hypothetical protein